MIDDLEAIFIIVSRNLNFPNWQNLILEAQVQIVEEAGKLLEDRVLAWQKKQQLLRQLKILHPYTTLSQQEQIGQILKVYDRQHQDRDRLAS